MRPLTLLFTTTLVAISLACGGDPSADVLAPAAEPASAPSAAPVAAGVQDGTAQGVTATTTVDPSMQPASHHPVYGFSGANADKFWSKHPQAADTV